MTVVRPFDGEKLLERSAAKPRKIGEREEKFPFANQQPEAMRRYVQNFNF
jgi:hypothetical protein